MASMEGDLPIQIISVVVEGQQVDSKVQGSHLSVNQYGTAVALVIRNISSLFSKNAQVAEEDVVEEILRVVNAQSRDHQIKSDTFTLQ